MEFHTDMASYKELLAQKAKLEQELLEARRRETSDAVKRVRDLIEEFGLEPSDVFQGAKGKPRSAGRGRVPAKYRNPETGETWSGRGRTPNWMKGKSKDAFLIG
jgi:DNA-binding protein H-NS